MADELLTLAELADRTGRSVESLRKRVARRQLTVVRSNDGRLRVKVDDQTISDLRDRRPNLRLSDRPDRQSATIKALEDHVQTLKERLEKAEAELQSERAAAAAERARL